MKCTDYSITSLDHIFPQMKAMRLLKKNIDYESTQDRPVGVSDTKKFLHRKHEMTYTVLNKG